MAKLLNSKPLFTIVMIIASIPVTIYGTFRVVKAAGSRIKLAAKKENSKVTRHRVEKTTELVPNKEK